MSKSMSIEALHHVYGNTYISTQESNVSLDYPSLIALPQSFSFTYYRPQNRDGILIMIRKKLSITQTLFILSHRNKIFPQISLSNSITDRNKLTIFNRF